MKSEKVDDGDAGVTVNGGYIKFISQALSMNLESHQRLAKIRIEVAETVC